ncbi:hypothetical protein BH09PLA1_BH09PLA1_31640 [soil metagenome]
MNVFVGLFGRTHAATAETIAEHPAGALIGNGMARTLRTNAFVSLRLLIAATVCAAAICAISYRAIRTSEAAPQSAVRTERAAFAAGCFWGVEETFRRLDGVVATTVGFAGGHLEHPTYKDLCSGNSGHAETVQVDFDPAKISYAELLDAFWSCHDPSRLCFTGPESGEPERSIIFFQDAEQQRVAEASRDEVNASGAFPRKIATELIPAGTFYPAEEYHQRYLAKLGQATQCAVGDQSIHTALAARAAAARTKR